MERNRLIIERILMKYGYQAALVVLLTLFSLGISVFVLSFTREIMTHSTLRQLDSVSSLQEHRLTDLLARYESEIELIQSRTNMRKKLYEFVYDGNREGLVAVQNILRDAVSAVPSLQALYLFAPDFTPVINSTTFEGRVFPYDFQNLLSEPYQTTHLGFEADNNSSASNHFMAPLLWENQLVGFVLVEFSAESLFDLTRMYDGLGKTGESGIAMKLNDEQFVSLTRLRHKSNNVLNIGNIFDKEGMSPIRQALLGHEEIYMNDITDYRSEVVFAATRYVEYFDRHWALTVKMDKEEAMADYNRLRFLLLFSLFGGLTAFALILGIYVMVTKQYSLKGRS